MPAPMTYSLSIRPQYAPNAQSPEYVFGQVLFLNSSNQHLACHVEFRADWTPDGEIETAQPEPPSLPSLTEAEIKARAEKFIALFRSDKMQPATPSAEDNDDEMESLQASDSGLPSEGEAAK